MWEIYVVNLLEYTSNTLYQDTYQLIKLYFMLIVFWNILLLYLDFLIELEQMVVQKSLECIYLTMVRVFVFCYFSQRLKEVIELHIGFMLVDLAEDQIYFLFFH